MKQVRLLLALLSACVLFDSTQKCACAFARVCACVCACVCMCVCVSEMGLAEMSKAGSHAVSGAADIALAVGGLQGGTAEVKEL